MTKILAQVSPFLTGLCYPITLSVVPLPHAWSSQHLPPLCTRYITFPARPATPAGIVRHESGVFVSCAAVASFLKPPGMWLILILVCSGHHDKDPQMEWPTELCLLTVLEAGRPRLRYWQAWFILRPRSLACKWPSFFCLHLVFPIPVCVLISSPYKDISHTGLVLQLNDLILT